MASANPQLDEILENLKKTQGIHGTALTERYGLVLSGALPAWIDAESLGAMVNLIVKASARATRELAQGDFKSAMIDNEKGRLIFMAIGSKILIIVATPNVAMGILQVKLQSAAQAIINLGVY
ncbi:MAG TPA: roadblock/LC7 domain-containing protein [Candidatus Lokiarchaeia archaeon]|nr:roadblock/LC7 domain-containing protein [Candidatus Lokiarchaeia archaeon]